MHYAGVDGRIVFPIVTIALAGLAWLSRSERTPSATTWAQG
jgi:hypothetical protein